MILSQKEIILKKGSDTSLDKGSYGGKEKNVQVMMEWEDDYMKACVNELKIGRNDNVLEIGFGMGLSATAIQEKSPKSHTIIECDEDIIQQIEKWKRKIKTDNVVVIENTWQNVLLEKKELSSNQYDCVFFDDFPLCNKLKKKKKKCKKLKNAARLFGSRWHVFISMISPWLGENTRVTGYCAERLKWNRKDMKLTLRPFPVTVPKHCVYARGKTIMYIPLIRRLRKGEDDFKHREREPSLSDECDGDFDDKKRKRRKLLNKVLSQLGM